jgi:hypothetical protein
MNMKLLQNNYQRIAKSLGAALTALKIGKMTWLCAAACVCIAAAMSGLAVFRKLPTQGHANVKQWEPQAAIDSTRFDSPMAAPRLEDESQRLGIIQMPSNAPSIDALIAEKGAAFYPSRISTGGKQLTGEMFLKPETCKECHGNIYNEWAQSIMSHSWNDPIYRAILKLASVATGGAVDNFCIGCHSPIGLTTGTAYAQSLETASSGVDCESCHTVSSITGLGNGSIVLSPYSNSRPIKYGPRNDALSPFHDTTYSDLHRKSEFCATCHNVTHPFNKLAVERTYDEWRDSYYHGAGIGCQECHMSAGPGESERPAQSAVNGKVRPRVFAHTFTGANVTLHRYFKEEEKVGRVTKMLKSAAIIKFVDEPETVKAGETLVIRVKVENVGAGHKLPTGFPEGREVWIDFQVRDGEGNELYRLGEVKDGHTEKGTKSFKATLGDPNGNVVDLNVWEADRVLSDTRILPKGFAEVEYVFKVPECIEGKLNIVADLLYMSFPQYVLDKLFGKDIMKSDITVMGSVHKEVQVTHS